VNTPSPAIVAAATTKDTAANTARK
jgi:hypothetical protein